LNAKRVTASNLQRCPGSTDAINIYRSSGVPGAPILIHDNYMQGVAPVTPDTLNFSGSGIVTDGDTADPLLATSSVEIANNQVVGCVTTGIALAFGTDQIAHDNVVVSSGLTPSGTPYACAWLGICIEGDSKYQPQTWLKWLQLMNNTVGCNDRWEAGPTSLTGIQTSATSIAKVTRHRTMDQLRWLTSKPNGWGHEQEKGRIYASCRAPHLYSVGCELGLPCARVPRFILEILKKRNAWPMKYSHVLLSRDLVEHGIGGRCSYSVITASWFGMRRLGLARRHC
jgi:hypothetical protein